MPLEKAKVPTKSFIFTEDVVANELRKNIKLLQAIIRLLWAEWTLSYKIQLYIL